MPTFLIERTLPPGITPEDLGAAALRSVDVLTEMPELKWIKSFLALKENKLFCLYEAPDAPACNIHAKRAQLPIDKVYEVTEIEPSMFK